MRTSRALGVLVALAVVASPAQSAAAPAPDRATTIQARQEYRTGVYTDGIGPAIPNDQVGFAGQLLDASGSPITGVRVQLQRWLRGEDSWSVIANLRTRKASSRLPGWAVFRTDVVGNGRYRVAFPGNQGHDASVSAPMRLRAMRDLNARLVERGRGAKKRASLAGDVNPGWEGRQVRWQKKACRSCRWRTVGHRRTSATGRWRFRAPYPLLHRTWYYRAEIRNTDRFVTSYSRVLRTRKVTR